MLIDLGIALCLAGARLDSGALLSTMMAMRGGDKYEREHRALIPIRAYRELAALRNRWGAGGESCAATGRDTPVGGGNDLRTERGDAELSSSRKLRLPWWKPSSNSQREGNNAMSVSHGQADMCFERPFR